MLIGLAIFAALVAAGWVGGNIAYRNYRGPR
jgi:hypothetical protein